MKRAYLFFLLLSLSSNAQIIITEVHYDTPFFEHSPNESDQNIRRHLGEYIELYNYSSEDIPLKGWFIADYASKYVFPDEAVIPSEGFIIIVYNSDSWHNSNSGNINTINYFPIFFPTTVGKETQIYYQNDVILRNPRELLRLYMTELKGVDTNEYKIHQVSWQNKPNNARESQDATFNPGSYNFYTSSSIHLNSEQEYLAGNPTPLISTYIPATQNMEDISTVIDAIRSIYSDLTWEDYSDEILFNICSLELNIVQQTPQETYTEIKRCFEYDNSGNKINSYDCSEGEDSQEGNEQEQIEYTSAELDEISSKIALYPVPTYITLNIQWDESINGKISTIQFLNQNGMLIGSQSIEETQNSTQFNFYGQPTGVYIVSFILDSGQIISKNIMKI